MANDGQLIDSMGVDSFWILNPIWLINILYVWFLIAFGYSLVAIHGSRHVSGDTSSGVVGARGRLSGERVPGPLRSGSQKRPGFLECAGEPKMISHWGQDAQLLASTWYFFYSDFHSHRPWDLGHFEDNLSILPRTRCVGEPLWVCGYDASCVYEPMMLFFICHYNL